MLIGGKQYSEEYLKKAIVFYEALLTGKIEEQLKEALSDES